MQYDVLCWVKKKHRGDLFDSVMVAQEMGVSRERVADAFRRLRGIFLEVVSAESGRPHIWRLSKKKF